MLYGLAFAMLPSALFFVAATIVFEYLYAREAKSLEGQFIEPCLIPEGCPKEPGNMPAVISMVIAAILVIASIALLMRWMRVAWKKAVLTGLSCILLSAVLILVGIFMNQSVDGNKLIVFEMITMYLGYSVIIAARLSDSTKIQP